MATKATPSQAGKLLCLIPTEVFLLNDPHACLFSLYSNFLKTATTSEQIQRQEQLIRKLTADLKKEKDESKKKDAALRKYESFYREVKARSAQKAAQRQEAQQRQRRNLPTSRVPR